MTNTPAARICVEAGEDGVRVHLVGGWPSLKENQSPVGIRIVGSEQPSLLEWAGWKLRQKYDPRVCRWIAGLDRGVVRWVAVYSGFSERDCSLSLASDGPWATRRALGWIFGVPFEQWRLARVTSLVAADNVTCLRTMFHLGRARLGFTLEGRLRDYFGEGNDGLAFGLLARDAKKWTERSASPPALPMAPIASAIPTHISTPTEH